MSRVALPLCVILLLAALIISSARGQEEAKTEAAPADKPAAAKDATHKVKQAPFKIEVNLSGVFEAKQMWPIVLRPESYSSFSVVEAVRHGERVQKGQTLVSLDMTDIDQQLQDLDYTLQLNKLSQQLAETEMELLKKTMPLDLESVTRSKRIAEEDLNYFLKIDKEFERESAEFSLKSSQDSLEYAEEELKQLNQMYNADDLTEETEEIVLKRARNDVERARFYLKSAKLRTDQTLTQTIVRQEQQLSEALQRAEIALAKSQATLPAQLEKQQVEGEKLLVANQRAEKKRDDLIMDRSIMAVQSPAEGYVFYGRCTRGKWSNTDSVATQLEEGGKLTPNNVFMTIVNPRPLFVRVEVPEKDLYRLQRGLTGKAVPAGYPDLELEATVDYVSSFPVSAGVFDGQVKVTLDEQAKPVVPGMSCKLTLVAYDKHDAITVPAAAVFEDEASGTRDIVYVKKGDEAPEKRKVVIGQKTEQLWEVTQGLQVDEEILLSKPDAS